MKDNGAKALTTFFLIVIAVICYLWWQSENSKVKRIEELKGEIEAYEEKVEELNGKIEELSEQIYTYEDEILVLENRLEEKK